jgi:hypothetical protein
MENFGRQVAALLMQAQPSERSFHLDANLWLSTPSLPRMASSALPSVAEGFLHSSGLLQGGDSCEPATALRQPSPVGREFNSLQGQCTSRKGPKRKVRLSALLFPTRLVGAWHVECGVESGPRMSGVLESSISRPVSAIIQRIHVSMRLWATEPVLISYRLGQESLGIHAKPSSPCRHRDRSPRTLVARFSGPVDCVRHPVWSAVAGGGVAEARCRTPLIVPVNDMVVPSIFGLLSYCTGTAVLNGVRCH